MDQTLTIFNQAVSDVSGFASTIGLPEGNVLDTSEVLVWPWRLEEQAFTHGLIDPVSGGRRAAQSRILCIVLAQDPKVLNQIKQGLDKQRMLGNGGAFIRVQYESLSVADMLALFSAARLVPRLCLPYVLEQMGA